MNCTPQNVSRLAKSAYKRIRVGEYAQELLSFLPERAIDRATKQIQNSFKDLNEQERGVIAMNEIGIDEEAIIQIVDRHMEECWCQKKLERKENLKEKANYNYRFQMLSLLLEHYREYPAGSRKKEFIDYIMERHRMAYREGFTEEFYKVRHNLLVCRFLLSKPMKEKEIYQRLGLTKQTYEKNLKNGRR